MHHLRGSLYCLLCFLSAVLVGFLKTSIVLSDKPICMNNALNVRKLEDSIPLRHILGLVVYIW